MPARRRRPDVALVANQTRRWRAAVVEPDNTLTDRGAEFVTGSSMPDLADRSPRPTSTIRLGP